MTNLDRVTLLRVSTVTLALSIPGAGGEILRPLQIPGHSPEAGIRWWTRRQEEQIVATLAAAGDKTIDVRKVRVAPTRPFNNGIMHGGNSHGRPVHYA